MLFSFLPRGILPLFALGFGSGVAIDYIKEAYFSAPTADEKNTARFFLHSTLKSEALIELYTSKIEELSRFKVQPREIRGSEFCLLPNLHDLIDDKIAGNAARWRLPGQKSTEMELSYAQVWREMMGGKLADKDCHALSEIGTAHGSLTNFAEKYVDGLAQLAKYVDKFDDDVFLPGPDETKELLTGVCCAFLKCGCLQAPDLATLKNGNELPEAVGKTTAAQKAWEALQKQTGVEIEALKSAQEFFVLNNIRSSPQ